MNNPRNPFGILFYPFVLVLLGTGIYFIYENNPALMDQLSLIEKQQQTKKTDVFVVKSQRADSGEVWDRKQTDVILPNNSFSHSKNHLVDHRYDFYKNGAELDDAQTWRLDSQGIIANDSNKIQLYDIEGEAQWSFNSEKPLCEGRVSANDKYLVVCFQSGGLSVFDRKNGQIIWSRTDKIKYLKNPILIENTIFTFEEGEDGKWSMAKTDAKTGQEEARLKGLPTDYVGSESVSKSKWMLVLAEKSGKVRAYDLKTMKAQWSSETEAEHSSAPAIAGDKVIAMTTDGLLIGYSVKTGEQLWDFNLKRSSPHSLAVAEGHGIGAITDADGYLHMLDVRAGKRKWRFNTQTDNDQKQMVAARLFSANAIRLNMGNESQGWLFWGPCKGHQICAFEPFKGLLVRRIDPKAGKVLHPPVYIPGTQKMLLLVLEDGKRVFKIYSDRDWLKDQKEETSDDVSVDNRDEDN